jgi:predicted RNA binding protein YcfA (HicA-like mRNA interferase family)
MPRLKNLSGEDIVAILLKCGFSIYNQKGSHVKLRRVNSKGDKQTLTIPNHKELDKGTIKAIYNQASHYIIQEILDEYFYN